MRRDLVPWRCIGINRAFRPSGVEPAFQLFNPLQGGIQPLGHAKNLGVLFGNVLLHLLDTPFQMAEIFLFIHNKNLSNPDNIHRAAFLGFLEDVRIFRETRAKLEKRILPDDVDQLGLSVIVHAPVIGCDLCTETATDALRLLVGDLDQLHQDWRLLSTLGAMT